MWVKIGKARPEYLLSACDGGQALSDRDPMLWSLAIIAVRLASASLYLVAGAGRDGFPVVEAVLLRYRRC
jgi:hypothetical protein